MLEAVNTIANPSKEIQQLERLEWFRYTFLEPFCMSLRLDCKTLLLPIRIRGSCAGCAESGGQSSVLLDSSPVWVDIGATLGMVALNTPETSSETGR